MFLWMYVSFHTSWISLSQSTYMTNMSRWMEMCPYTSEVGAKPDGAQQAGRASLVPVGPPQTSPASTPTPPPTPTPPGPNSQDQPARTKTASIITNTSNCNTHKLFLWHDFVSFMQSDNSPQKTWVHHATGPLQSWSVVKRFIPQDGRVTELVHGKQSRKFIQQDRKIVLPSSGQGKLGRNNKLTWDVEFKCGQKISVCTTDDFILMFAPFFWKWKNWGTFLGASAPKFLSKFMSQSGFFLSWIKVFLFTCQTGSTQNEARLQNREVAWPWATCTWHTHVCSWTCVPHLSLRGAELTTTSRNASTHTSTTKTQQPRPDSTDQYIPEPQTS